MKTYIRPITLHCSDGPCKGVRVTILTQHDGRVKVAGAFWYVVNGSKLNYIAEVKP